MSQCFLTSQNGFLGLAEPKRRATCLLAPGDSEWAPSDLDEIQLDVFRSSSEEFPEKPSRDAYTNYSRSYRNQRRLVILNNRVAIRKPQNDDANDPKSPTLFLKLPVEVRLLIYRHLLITHGLPSLCPEPGGFRVFGATSHGTPYNLHPQILATCRQINREGTSLLYSENVFRRQFLWRTVFTRSGKRLSPRSDSSPLKATNLESISRVRIFENHERWLRKKGELKVLQEFPSLRELHIRIDLGSDRYGGDLAPNLVLKHTLRAVSNHHALILFEIHLARDENFYDWTDRCCGSLDFSLHRAKKTELEAWIREKDLFVGRSLVWTFTTRVPDWCGPSGVINLDIGDCHSGICPNTITCLLKRYDGTRSTLEPI
ncbi:hypothetical protein EDB81DRAFT_808442 [Dactylonectria macrodidyma]|uniref:Uncharacterized protein n=1 Tax=Dactylonectria macrodidyma TaxID=307937 RepID=A0A9P9INB7_9HYPO|nr:hypothetical protein EDB81DRAFT_808442 [Dactylonectria macrodidyma]